MSEKKENNDYVSPFRNPFSFGNNQRLTRTQKIDNDKDEKNKDKNEEVKELKKPKNKKSHFHTKKSFSISISTDEYNYWKKVAKMNKKSLSALVRDIVNEKTEYKFKE